MNQQDSQPTPPSNTEPEWLTPRQVADLLGQHITSVYSWIRKGKLKAYRTPGGRLLRIKPSDILGLPYEPKPRAKPTLEEMSESTEKARQELDERGHKLMGEGE